MRIINETKRNLPTALPAQDISATGTPPDPSNDIKLYDKPYQDLYVVLEDSTGADVAFSDVELEMWGYFDNDSTPMLIYKATIDSDHGKIMVPINDIPAVKYVYCRQAADSNPVGATGASNAACDYQIVLNAKWSNG